MRSSKYKQHQNFLKKQLKEAQLEFKNMRFFERHVGLFYTKNGSPVKINKPGMSDVWAIALNKNQSIHFEIEFKTGAATLSPAQKKWRAFCDAHKIPFILVTEKCTLVEQLNKFFGGNSDDANQAGRAILQL